MNELRQKVAKAIFECGFHPDDVPTESDAKWLEWAEERPKAHMRADAAILAVMEALQTPTEAMIKAGVHQIDFDRDFNTAAHDPLYKNGVIDLQSQHILPSGGRCATTVGQDIADCWQAMLGAVQQENVK